MLAEFPSALNAVACALEAQRDAAARNARTNAERRIHLRIGIASGRRADCGVLAQRLESLAEPDGLCVSADVHRQVEGRVSAT